MGTTSSWLLLVSVPKHTEASPVCPWWGRCPHAHTAACSLPGPLGQGLLPPQHPLGPPVWREHDLWGQQGQGDHGTHCLGSPSSGKATPGKGIMLSPPGTELPPFLAVSVPSGSAQAMPSHPQPPSKVAQRGHHLSPKGLQQSQGLAPMF